MIQTYVQKSTPSANRNDTSSPTSDIIHKLLRTECDARSATHNVTLIYERVWHKLHEILVYSLRFNVHENFFGPAATKYNILNRLANTEYQLALGGVA